jgi:hypothetical protein
VIYLSRQLSEVNFFRQENLVPRKGVFSDILDDTRGAEYTLYKGTKVGGRPEQPGV